LKYDSEGREQVVLSGATTPMGLLATPVSVQINPGVWGESKGERVREQGIEKKSLEGEQEK